MNPFFLAALIGLVILWPGLIILFIFLGVIWWFISAVERARH